jgi:hypothetical protein
MNEHEPAALEAAVEDAITLLRDHAPQFRAALSPVVDSLDAVCASLREAMADAASADRRAAVLVVSRDLITTALNQLPDEPAIDRRAVMLALATVHNRIAAALEACTVPESAT